jgi:hypothetical protein
MKQRIVLSLFTVLLYTSIDFLGEAVDTTTIENDKRVAAKNVIQAMASKPGLLNDLTILLKDSFDDEEISAMINDVISTTTTNSNTTTIQECPAVSKKSSSETHDDNSSSNSSSSTVEDPKMYHADRHAAGVVNSHNNYDCLQREFDAKDPKFDIEEAKDVLERCRILVIRNVFPKEIVDRALRNINKYINDVETSKIKSEGTTTYGGEYFILREDKGRVNYMLTKELAESAAKDIVTNENVLNILSDYRLLDENFVINHMGTLNAQPGAPAQGWHSDDEYIFGKGSFHEFGVAGHDLPPFAISMFTPLLQMTYEHGPTEFCIGTSNLRGHRDDLFVEDETLLETGIVQALHSFERQQHGRRQCPKGFERSPLLNLGDIVLFDYMITHRGGPNNSNDLRSMLFTVYSRKWFRDSTFDIKDYDEEDDDDFERLTQITRFAVVERADE